MRSSAPFVVGSSIVLLLALVLIAKPQTATDDSKINTLTDEEKKAGWELLFDGKNFTGWHNFKREGVRPGWQVNDGDVLMVAGSRDRSVASKGLHTDGNASAVVSVLPSESGSRSKHRRAASQKCAACLENGSRDLPKQRRIQQKTVL